MLSMYRLFEPLQRYARWLHLGWPANVPEKLPETGPDGKTSIPGLRIAGDLLGIPLLQFAADSGARAVQAFIEENAFANGSGTNGSLDLAIIGGGVAGLSAALEAKKAGLNFMIYEAGEPFSTITNFTNGKPIFTYPADMIARGELQLTASRKETLLADLQTQARDSNIDFEIRRVERVERKGKLLELNFADNTPPISAKRVLVCTGRR
ncbi:MAG: FAD-dependent oxidoreductase [Gammaproteobacteria bacterium]